MVIHNYICILFQCWDKERIFIWQLSGMFLKASALFVSRYLKEIQRQITRNSKVETTHLINASHDVRKCEVDIPEFLSENLNEVLKFTNFPSTFPASLDEFQKERQRFISTFEWSQTKEELEAKLIEVTAGQSMAHISLVTEVPRLFRRTNRETPTKHSEYVNGMLNPIEALVKEMGSAKDQKVIERVGQQVLNR